MGINGMLNHTFLLLTRQNFESLVENYRKANFYYEPEVFKKISISDDIILSTVKLLKNIKTRNYKDEQDCRGLEYYGITIIYPENLTEFKKVFTYVNENIKEYSTFCRRKKIKKEVELFTLFLQEGIENKLYMVHNGI